MRNVLSLIQEFLILSLIVSIAFGQWPASPDSAIYLGGYAEFKQAISDLHGGAYVVWGTTHTNCARINRHGEIEWLEVDFLESADGDEVYHQSISLSSDSCLLISYKTTSYVVVPEFGDAEIRVQKIDSLGNKLWGEGIVVTPENVTGENLLVNSILSMVSNTTDGGAYVAWTDFSDDSPDHADLFLQRLDQEGDIIWDTSGVHISERASNLMAARTNYYGDFQIAYQHGTWGEPVHKVQRVTAAGVALYDAGGAIFPVAWASGFSFAFDDLGNVFCAVDSMLYGLDTSGTNIWPSGYRFSNGSEMVTEIIPSQENGIVILFQDIRGIRKTVVQYVDSEGILRFGTDGMEIFDGRSSRSTGVISDEGFILTRRDIDHFAIKLGYTGNYIWEVPYLLFFDAQVSAGLPLAITDMNGGLIYFFQFNWALLATHINSDGSLGPYLSLNEDYEVLTISNKISYGYPNPSNQGWKIKWYVNKPGRYQFTLYSITGRRINSNVRDILFAGETTYNFQLPLSSVDSHSGIYFLSIVNLLNPKDREVIRLCNIK
ncbi:T9SS type A sorting domain-containing protein [bacterium]|nr:T9SS type A sorting domain-containing protein [bacterium]